MQASLESADLYCVVGIYSIEPQSANAIIDLAYVGENDGLEAVLSWLLRRPLLVRKRVAHCGHGSIDERARSTRRPPRNSQGPSASRSKHYEMMIEVTNMSYSERSIVQVEMTSRFTSKCVCAFFALLPQPLRTFSAAFHHHTTRVPTRSSCSAHLRTQEPRRNQLCRAHGRVEMHDGCDGRPIADQRSGRTGEFSSGLSHPRGTRQ